MKFSKFAKYLKESATDNPEAIVVVSCSDVTGVKTLSPKQMRNMGRDPKSGNDQVRSHKAVDAYYLVTKQELDKLLKKTMFFNNMEDPSSYLLTDFEKMEPVIVQATGKTDYGDKESANFEDNVKALLMVFGELPIYNYRTSYNDFYRASEMSSRYSGDLSDTNFLKIMDGEWFEVDLSVSYLAASMGKPRRKSVAAGIEWKLDKKATDEYFKENYKNCDPAAERHLAKYIKMQSKRIGMNEDEDDSEDVSDIRESFEELTRTFFKFAEKIGYKVC